MDPTYTLTSRYLEEYIENIIMMSWNYYEEIPLTKESIGEVSVQHSLPGLSVIAFFHLHILVICVKYP